MSVPKPIVRRVRPPQTVEYTSWDGSVGSVTYPAYWDWECACRTRPHQRTGSSLDVAIHGAIQHSRTHTAERIAGELLRRYRSAAADEHAARDRRDWGEADYWMGRKDEALDAIDLIRKHLVKEAT